MAEDQDIINANAQAPKKASGDTGMMEQHSIPDQIEADRYAASKKAMKKKGFGIRRFKMIPPGAD